MLEKLIASLSALFLAASPACHYSSQPADLEPVVTSPQHIPESKELKLPPWIFYRDNDHYLKASDNGFPDAEILIIQYQEQCDSTLDAFIELDRLKEKLINQPSLDNQALYDQALKQFKANLVLAERDYDNAILPALDDYFLALRLLDRVEEYERQSGLETLQETWKMLDAFRNYLTETKAELLARNSKDK